MSGTADDSSGARDEVAVGMRVCVYPASTREAHGIVVDDFGPHVGVPIDIGGNRVVEPARRWAVTLDDDTLLFVDSDHVVGE